MKNLIIHPEMGEIRVKIRKGEPIFRGKDICTILGLSNSNKALGSLESYERIEGVTISDPLGGKQEAVFVTEGGLYSLIFKSRKPEAKRFTRWVTSEVLPSIRKYGFYSRDKRVIDRAEARLEQKAVKEMLSVLDAHLSATDEKAILKQTRVSSWHLSSVLRGETKDVALVALIYARVTGNKALYNTFYSKRGAEKLIAKLKK